MAVYIWPQVNEDKHIEAHCSKSEKTKLGNYYSISLDYTAIFMPVPCQ